MSLIQNVDLIVLGVAIAATGMLGFIVFFNNRTSATNRAFLYFSLTSIVWGILNFASYQASTPTTSLWLWRLVIFSAIWFCFAIFNLSLVFPKQENTLGFRYRFFLLPFVFASSLLTLTPFVFETLTSTPAQGVVPAIKNGLLIPVFGLTVGGLVMAALFQFITKLRKAAGALRQQYGLILAGTFITFTLLIVFNYILPTNFQIYHFIPFGAVFIFPFIGCTAYAIYQYKLFNVKVIATQVLAFLLTIAALIQVVFSTNPIETVFRVAAFLLTLIASIFLVQSVMREVEQRIEIQRLAEDLKVANEKLKELDVLKSQFLSMASHDLRAPLTIIRNFVSLLLEGAYGKLADAGQEGLKQVFDRATDMAKSVETYLDVSRIEQGRMKYDFIDIELLPLVKNSVKAFEPAMQKKGLKLTTSYDPALEGLKAKIDVAKMNEILNNLIDNTIKYTPTGEIWFSAKREGSIAKITIKDTGVGMTQETLKNLFQLFRPGEDSKRVNPASTGVGLYITKAHVLAHKGTVRAESEGTGKGSLFTLELPLLT